YTYLNSPLLLAGKASCENFCVHSSKYNAKLIHIIALNLSYYLRKTHPKGASILTRRNTTHD
ncbi:hypothetical protein V1477_020498, partial [Vespula maculifrons]